MFCISRSTSFLLMSADLDGSIASQPDAEAVRQASHRKNWHIPPVILRYYFMLQQLPRYPIDRLVLVHTGAVDLASHVTRDDDSDSEAATSGTIDRKEVRHILAHTNSKQRTQKNRRESRNTSARGTMGHLHVPSSLDALPFTDAHPFPMIQKDIGHETGSSPCDDRMKGNQSIRIRIRARVRMKVSMGNVERSSSGRNVKGNKPLAPLPVCWPGQVSSPWSPQPQVPDWGTA